LQNAFKNFEGWQEQAQPEVNWQMQNAQNFLGAQTISTSAITSSPSYTLVTSPSQAVSYTASSLAGAGQGKVQ
jgi:hypothetical protein